MEEKRDFTIEESEALMSNLNSKATPEFEKLRSALNLLAHVNELSPTSTPPVLPSQIGRPVQLLTRKSTRSRRTIITSILSVGLLASASLAAAAVTGRGPAPFVSVAHESAKIVRAVAGAVNHAVTRKNSDSQNNPASNENKVGNKNENSNGTEKDNSNGVSTENRNGGGANGSDNSGKNTEKNNGSGNGNSNGNSGDGQSGDSGNSLTGPSSAPTSEGKKSNSNSGDNNSNSSEKNSSSGSGEKNHSSNDGSRTPTAKPSQDQGGSQSAGDNSSD